MVSQIVPQNESQVKRCADEHCDEDVFRDDLCLDHLIAVDTAAWDDEDAERQAALEGMGYIFGDPVGMLA